MSTLKAKLRGIAEDELLATARQIHDLAAKLTKDIAIDRDTLLRLAAGGKVQVLHNKAIKALTDAKEAELLESLSKQETE